MKSLTFNKNSWHFYLATRLGGYVAPYPYMDRYGKRGFGGDKGDICTYTQYVLKGMSGLMFIFALSYVLSICIVEMVFSIAFSIYYQADLFSNIGAGATIFTVLSSIACGISLIVSNIIEKNSNKRYAAQLAAENNPERVVAPDGFIKHAYKSWKQKFCVQVNFTGETK